MASITLEPPHFELMLTHHSANRWIILPEAYLGMLRRGDLVEIWRNDNVEYLFGKVDKARSYNTYSRGIKTLSGLVEEGANIIDVVPPQQRKDPILLLVVMVIKAG